MALVVAVLVGLVSFNPVRPAAAGPGDGTLTIEVYRTFAGLGARQPEDLPQPGIDVVVSDADGNALLLTSNANGEVVVPAATVLTGGRYRIDAAIPGSLGYLRPAPAAPATVPDNYSAMTTFVDVSGGTDATVRLAVWNPADYVQDDVPVAVVVQSCIGAAEEVGYCRSDGDTRSLVRYPYSARGEVPSTDLNEQSQTGTTFGLAYDKVTGLVYQSAYAKRLTSYGPGGNGAIYATPADGSAAPVLFTTVADTGSTPHLMDESAPPASTADPSFFDVPGKEGLGGIAISEDNTTLYAVNLNLRALVSIPTAGGAHTVQPIPGPGCGGGDALNWRPFSVAVRDGLVYVGGVCSAESTGDRDDLEAIVYSFDGATFGLRLRQALNYVKTGGNIGPSNECNDSGAHPTAHPETNVMWNPWITTWSNDPDVLCYYGQATRPSPILAQIAFDADGSMILGFRDRSQDQYGSRDPGPTGTASRLPFVVNSGQVARACHLGGGTYVWEGTPPCPNNYTVPPYPSATANGFPNPMSYFPGTMQGAHYATAMGGVAFAPSLPDVVATVINPTDYYQNGLGFLDRTTGEGPRETGSTQDPDRGLVVATDNGFSKQAGLGALTLLADLAPVQIGNRVWYDADRDGGQDADELPIPGATVRLYDATGTTLLATTTTDVLGQYYFGGPGAAYQLEPGVDYVVEFDISTADTSALPGAPIPDDLSYTTPGTFGPEHDSNPTPLADPQLARAVVTAPTEPGGVDHSIDAGVVLHYGVDIEKGDTGSAAPGPIVNDADTVADAAAYAPGESRQITFTVTNTGAHPLYNVAVGDHTLAGRPVSGLACVFPGQSAPGTAGTQSGSAWSVYWAETFGDAVPDPVAWDAGVSFTCTATLTLDGDDVPHVDRATVLTALAPSGSPGNATQDGPGDDDDYVAFTGDIQVIKYDGNRPDPVVGTGPASWAPPAKPLTDAGQDANTPDAAVNAPADVAQPVRWVVSNTGATWLADITLADSTGAGPAVGAWTCDLTPVGGPAAYSFAGSGPWAGPLAPGASFFCAGPLTLPAGTTHANTVAVTGTVLVPELDSDGQPVLDQDGVPRYLVGGGEMVRSGIVVGDDDPFHAVTAPRPPDTTPPATNPPSTTTPPPVGTPAPPVVPTSQTVGPLPATGGNAARPAAYATALAGLGLAFLVISRRRRPTTS